MVWGLWSMVYGFVFMSIGIWLVVYCSSCIVHGFMAYVLHFVFYLDALRSVVYGLWHAVSVVSGLWFADHGLLLMFYGLRFIAFCV